MDPLDTFEVPYDDSDDIDVVMRAWGITKKPGNHSQPLRSIVTPIADAVAGYSIDPRPSQKNVRLLQTKSSNKSKQVYFKDGEWHKAKPRASQAPKQFVIYYIGYRSKKVSAAIGFMNEGRLTLPPKPEGWVCQTSEEYAYAHQAIRNFLLGFMAPELREKYHPSLVELHHANVKQNSLQLSIFEPFAHFVALHDVKNKKLIIYKISIEKSEGTEYYPFTHYKIKNPTIISTLNGMDSTEMVEAWLTLNIVHHATPSI